MNEDAVRRRAERAEQAQAHVEAQHRRKGREAAEAQILVDRFVARAMQAGLPTEELSARPWSGRGRYRTGVVGWYVRRDQSVGVGVDGGYYMLVVTPDRLGRWRGVSIAPSPPPLQAGSGARDGESVALDVLLEMRLHWSDEPAR